MEQMQWQRRQKRLRQGQQVGKSTSRHNERQEELDWSDYPFQSMHALAPDDRLDGPDPAPEKELGYDPALLDLPVESCRLQDG